MKRLVVALALAASACGVDTTGSGGDRTTPSGTTIVATGSLPLSAASGTAVVGSTTCQLDSGPAAVAYAVLLATVQPGICGYLQQNAYKANERAIELGVFRFDPTGSTASVTAGSYAILVDPAPGTSHAFLVVAQNDAACHSSGIAATSGMVNVTATAGSTFQGTVTAMLGDGGTVTGVFAADACAATVSGDVCAGEIGLSSPSCLP